MNVGETTPNSEQKYSGGSDSFSFYKYPLILIMRSSVEVPLVSLRHIETLNILLMILGENYVHQFSLMASRLS